MNMAIDQVLMETSDTPVVRFYQWQKPAVSIGRFQSLEEEVDVEKCRELAIDFVRRNTGGGAVFHDKELTYSVCIKEQNPFIPYDLRASYEKICQAVIEGLKKIGILAEYVFLNDIAVNGKKISGCAQTRKNGKLLQHGTLLLDVDVEKMFDVLKVPNEKIKDKMISNVKERVTCLKKELGRGVNFEEASRVLKLGFESYFKISFFQSELSEKEINMALKIKQEKFLDNNWNYAR
jgi:lipoate-protein ligase A